MSCCVPLAVADLGPDPGATENDDRALATLARPLSNGRMQIEFAVPDAHCAACIRSIENGLAALPMVESARVNLTRRRVRIVYDPENGLPSALAPAIRAAGYHTYVLDPATDRAEDSVLAELVRAMAVSGFAAGNIMLFSVSVWSGADAATRDLFHWLSAAIALPAIVYAGRIFFRSAWRALRVGKTNMDVPISIGIILATMLSLIETIRSGPHAYFDGATMLLFFLLIGRSLDHLMRERAREAVSGLARLQPAGGTLVREDGGREYVRLDEIRAGMLLEIRAGERVPVDAVVESSSASLDESIVTGESAPRTAGIGAAVMSGALSLSGTVLVRATRASTDSFLARMAAMMEAAENAKTRPRRIADRASALYAPIVHTIAAFTLLGWGVATGDWHQAFVNAIAVLIITCPCALALAVPIAHVVAAGRLFERGVLMKDGAALERLAEVDRVAFDKTGTLTVGRPALVSAEIAGPTAQRAAAILSAASTHPLSRTIARYAGPTSGAITQVSESAGLGLEATIDGQVWRLGSGRWCGAAADVAGTTVWLSCDGAVRGTFTFEDTLRPDAAEAVAAFTALRLPVQLLSGDNSAAVQAVAADVGIADARSALSPADKMAQVANGHTLMVGDGINDAPALRAAHVSMAPATAADIGRNAADFVFTGTNLSVVPFAVGLARDTSRIVSQNLAIAIGYNAIAVPLAVSGHVTPLIAALAMSASSIIVVANAMRLRLGNHPPVAATETATVEAVA